MARAPERPDVISLIPDRTTMSRRSRMRKRRKPPQRSPWFGLLKAELDADRQQRGEPPCLLEDEVLAWADAFLARTGDWPEPESGPIPEAPGETWLLVAAALAFGVRGFPPKGSIPRFLNEHRGRYNMKDPKFTVGQILDWADAWHARTGDWPSNCSGAIPGAGGVSWGIVNTSLRMGRGAVPGGSSLPHLLATERGVLPPYTEEQILAWADAFHERTGRWPSSHYGPITDATGETWCAVNAALEHGCRGLLGGSSLARLLIERRGMRSVGHTPPLTIPQILAWADAHHQRTGNWPAASSGSIRDAPGETWRAVHSALCGGYRGFPGGSTLAALLVEHRGKRSKGYAPSLSVPMILAWADAFRARNGRWPSADSGPVAESPGETWCAINASLTLGARGLTGSSSLSRLLLRERNLDRASDRPTLKIPEILRWADAFHDRHGEWPNHSSGPIPEDPGKTWENVNVALRRAKYGLPGGTSLLRLLNQERGVRHPRALAPLTAGGILAWADAHHARTGEWPHHLSGAIPEAPRETWSLVQTALRKGHRGIPGGSSLFRFLAQSGRVRHRVQPRKLTMTRSSPEPTHSSRAAAYGKKQIPAASSRHASKPGMPSIAPAIRQTQA